MSKKFIMCKGLPGSGKSTWAEEKVLAWEPGKVVRVNMDLFRVMLHADRWGGSRTEKIVAAARNETICLAMERGVQCVISDDTNLNPKCEAQFRDFCQKYGYEFTVQDFTDVPLETCVKRDLRRTRSCGREVIERMYNDYLRPEPEVYEFTSGLPTAVIFDVDGTLAHMVPGPDGKVRSPYDYSRVHEDAVDEAVAGLARTLQLSGNKILIVSGRDDDCEKETVAWLRANHVPFDRVFMRQTGDKRPDYVVKREIFDREIRSNWNVRFVVDDRNSVVAEWRKMGLKCLQAQLGAF